MTLTCDMTLSIPTWVGITEEGSGEQTDAARSIRRSHQAQSDSRDSQGTQEGSKQHLGFKLLCEKCQRIQDVGVGVVYRGPADGVHLKTVTPAQTSLCTQF